ncbi:MAG: hypothetical protein IKD66_00940 [Solobacterium sp.]|nr:hypothetical protein [Solobacterium sp.]
MTCTPIYAETVPEDETEPVQSEVLSETSNSPEDDSEELSGKQEKESEEPEEELKETEEESSADPEAAPEAEGKEEVQEEEAQEEKKEENKEDREFTEEGKSDAADSFDDLTSEESFSMYFNELLKSKGVDTESGSSELSFPVKRRESLGENEKFFYDLLLERVIRVANGDESSTVFKYSPDILPKNSLTNEECQELFGEDLIVDDRINPKAKDYLYSFVVCEMSLVMGALKADYPQYFFWADRGSGVVVTQYPSVSANDFELWFSTDGSVSWRVSPAYRPASGNQYETDAAKIKGVQSALDYAENIATTEAAGKTDYEKLLFFNDKVDELTDYNYDARDHIDTYSKENVNPWEVIYVFDGDPNTKVVCEGYAKAFKLLCDIAGFRRDIKTYVVTGDMSGQSAVGGAHMWNIVRMGDGKNYLVDPTCNDTLGDHSLFLAGTTSGSVETGYTIRNGTSIYYDYDSKTKDLYAVSELELSDSNYVDPGDDPEAPKIISNPENVTVMAGENAQFHVTATGDGLRYQWQISEDNGQSWQNLSGAEYPSALTKDFVINADLSNNGNLFRCVVTDQYGETVTSDSAKLTVEAIPVPEIISNPEDVTVMAGENAQFHVTAAGDGLSYQWKISTDNGRSWEDVSGARYPSALTKDFVINADLNNNGNLFRCVVTNQYGETAASESAKLTVEPIPVPEIISNPEDAAVTAGENAQFHVTAAGDGLSYQWQMSKDSGTSWENLNSRKFPTAVTADFEIKASTGTDGYLFRCVVTNQYGQTATSQSAKLTVAVPAPVITSQPEDAVVKAGENAQFHVKASGTGLKYQWQLSKDNGNSWTTLSGTKFPTAVTADFEIKASTNNNGYLFRCIITDQYGQTVTSKNAKLSLEATPVPEIISQPEDVEVKAGAKAQFHVIATGVGLKYQWQLSRDNGINWANLNGTKFPTAVTADFGIKASTNNNNYYFRCIITDQSGQTVTSDKAKLSLEAAPAPVITSQPEDAVVKAGENAQFHVTAAGTGLKYKWQLSKDNGSTWTTLSGTKFPTAVTADFEIKGSKTNNGYLFRCIVSDESGQSVTSENAKLTLQSSLVITSQPEDATVPAGENAQFHVTATGEGLSYQWQLSRDNGLNWANLSKTKFPTAVTADFEIKASKSVNGYLFRCVVSDQNGQSVTSENAKLSLQSSLVITSQPEDAAAAIGENAQFHVTATGEGLSYQWQLSRDNGLNWVNLNGKKFPTALTADFEIKASTGTVHNLFRCVVSDQNGQTVTSEGAKLTLITPSTLEIVSQPEDCTVPIGENAVFSVEANGEGLTYQWYLSRDNGMNWVKLNGRKFPSALTADFEIKGSTSTKGNLFHCVVTDAYGNSLTSDAAHLELDKAVVILADPEDVTAQSGETVKFTVSAYGDGLTYQWQYLTYGSYWTDCDDYSTGKSKTLSFVADGSLNGNEYRCIVTDAYENMKYSDSALLTVN